MELRPAIGDVSLLHVILHGVEPEVAGSIESDTYMLFVIQYRENARVPHLWLR